MTVGQEGNARCQTRVQHSFSVRGHEVFLNSKSVYLHKEGERKGEGRQPGDDAEILSEMNLYLGAWDSWLMMKECVWEDTER